MWDQLGPMWVHGLIAAVVFFITQHLRRQAIIRRERKEKERRRGEEFVAKVKFHARGVMRGLQKIETGLSRIRETRETVLELLNRPAAGTECLSCHETTPFCDCEVHHDRTSDRHR